MDWQSINSRGIGQWIVQKLWCYTVDGYRTLRGWLQFKIGPRLLASFLTIILLTGFIGLLAVQQLRKLTATTDELNAHDLPYEITIAHVHSLLEQQLVLEQRLVSAGDPKPAEDQAALASNLDEMGLDNLLSFGTPDRLTQITGEVNQSSINSRQILALVQNKNFNGARSLLQNKQGPLLHKLSDETAQLHKIIRHEVTTSAARVQQQSNRLTGLILGLTLFSVLFSAAMALMITRSLTRPLSALLKATQAMTSGGLKVDPQIVPGDELGQLAATFNAMFLNLQSTIAVLAFEQQQTQAIIEASADGLMLVDGQQKILQINPAAERLSGWARSEAIGLSCWEVLGCHSSSSVQAEERECACPLRHALQTNSEQIAEMHACARNGQQRWYALSCAPIPQASGSVERSRLVVGIHDISQHKAVEQLKSDFVAMVSHELRAPLTTVTASVETLETTDPIDEQESYREVVGILSQQTGRLRKVVEEVLQFAQVDAGRLQVHLQPVLLVQFLDELLENMRVAWVGNDRPLSLTASGPSITVWADRAALEIVVRNLLENAYKYTPSDSPIEVIVEASKEDHVLVRINDRGPGIPPNQLSRIFQSFSRGARASCNWTRGYGLGLYIAREVMRAHSGEIWAENRPGGGASLVFTLRIVRQCQ